MVLAVFRKKKSNKNTMNKGTQIWEGGEGRISFVSLLVFFFVTYCVSPFLILDVAFLYRSMGSKEKPRRVWLAIIIISLSIKPDTIIITLPFFLPPFQFIIHCFFFV